MPDIERVQQYSSVSDRIPPADRNARQRHRHRDEEHPQEPEDVVDLHEEPADETPSEERAVATEPEHFDLSA